MRQALLEVRAPPEVKLVRDRHVRTCGDTRLGVPWCRVKRYFERVGSGRRGVHAAQRIAPPASLAAEAASASQLSTCSAL